MDIKAIIRRIETGDKAAFAAIVGHFQRPLFGYLGRMGMRQAQAEEIAQETFLRAWSHLEEFDPLRAEFSTWLFTIARNFALHELARPLGRHEVATGDELPDVACERPQPSQALSEARARSRVLTALRALPPLDRSALALAYYKELDMESIAHIEGCSVGAIKVRLHRARARLRQLLEHENG